MTILGWLQISNQCVHPAVFLAFVFAILVSSGFSWQLVCSHALFLKKVFSGICIAKMFFYTKKAQPGGFARLATGHLADLWIWATGHRAGAAACQAGMAGRPPGYVHDVSLVPFSYGSFSFVWVGQRYLSTPFECQVVSINFGRESNLGAFWDTSTFLVIHL